MADTPSTEKDILPPEKVSKTKKSVEDYIQEARMYGDVPKDQFGHQFKLLFHPQSSPKSQMDLLPPDAILGVVQDSKTLVLLQNDITLLNRFFDMGIRSDGILELFNSLYYSWWQQMRMTGALGGTERWLQSFLEPSGIQYEGLSFAEKQKAKKQFKIKGVRDYLKQVGGGGEKKIYE